MSTTTVERLSVLETKVDDLGEKFASLEKKVDVLDVKLDGIKDQLILSAGKEKGLSLSWAWIVGGLGFVAAVIALLLNTIRLFQLGQ
ncbi:hypothetical protein M0R04_15120 [Candidatus Dojkabacteria bacterium]|jgi:hypothetical protein|nr:hypothetical protein [Candidatus Dojkabacteria bacterium]